MTGTGIYSAARYAFFQQARHMIETHRHEQLSTCMQHACQDTDRIIALCTRAVEDMSCCLKGSLDRLEQGDDLRGILDPAAFPHYVPRTFPETPAGGRASAVCDTALLIATIDPLPFSSYAGGDVQDDLLSYLNSTLHTWLLNLQEQWDALRPEIEPGTKSLFKVPLPPAEKEKATLKTVLLALCQAFNIGPERPSPYASMAAAAFASSFSVKLWPCGNGQNPECATQQGCILDTVSADFQEWYFSVGKTQLPDKSPSSVHLAEDVFVDLREQFHTRSRQCNETAGKSCSGSCVEDSLAPLPDAPFKERCHLAVKHIVLQMQKP